MKYRVNAGISYEAPGKPIEVYYPGEMADLSGWPDLERLVAEGTIAPVEEQTVATAPEQPANRSRLKHLPGGSEEI